MTGNETHPDASAYSKCSHVESDGRTTPLKVLKGCIMCCYIFCPPTPNAITSKLAFHPPKKGSYTAAIAGSPSTKLVGKKFRIHPWHSISCSPADYEDLLGSTEFFVLQTSRKNIIVCTKCSLRVPPTEKNLSDIVVIFAQPNASDLGDYLQPNRMNIPRLAELFGTDVYAFDYSGYGMSTGKPSEKNVYADIRAVHQHVRKSRSDKKIVLIGYSLGTAAVSDLACNHPDGIVGVVLVAPFTSGLRLYQANPTKETSCMLDKFRTCDKVAHIKVPLLVCHGKSDDVIDVEHGLEVKRRAFHPVPELIVDDADHITIFSGKYMQTFERIRQFLAEELVR
ncbi:hypothetical protein Q1695_012547 [Nippostrongylus brasiliensis]|nr:hypothetical protein Q1695_012547 [Nippostrongylus brasiliensis]